jgi:cell fate regulator YaaT (PSP1 superfamily)
MDEPGYLVGVRLREGDRADDYRLADGLELHVGDFVLVEAGDGEAMGEVRRPRRPLPDFKRDRAYPRVLRAATDDETRRWRERREREKGAVVTCQDRARARSLPMKVVDVEMHPTARRVTVYFNAEERVDFRELVGDLAREFRSRIEMRQIGARDVTRVMDGIGPCGRQLCCSSHLRRFEPISVKMAKTQDMPLTDSRLLGNCGRLKCCLLYEFSLYEELRSRLPRVNTPCQATCGGGCMSGKVRSLRVLKQSVVVGFPDGTEAEVPLDQLTWEGRPHIQTAEPAAVPPGGGAGGGAEERAPEQGGRRPDQPRRGDERPPGQGRDRRDVQARPPADQRRPADGQGRGPREEPGRPIPDRRPPGPPRSPEQGQPPQGQQARPPRDRRRRGQGRPPEQPRGPEQGQGPEGNPRP